MLVHRVLGLTAGLALVVTGVTGSALVFRPEIDRALAPSLLVVQPAATRAPLQRAIDDVQARFPGEAIARIRIPATADASIEFTIGGKSGRQVYVDPYRGTILGSRGETESAMGWLFQLHSHWLAGERGERVGGVLGLLLVVMGVSGIVAWWPRAGGQARRGMRVRWRHPAHRVHFDLHRAVGFYSSVLLVLSGLTGASLVFHDPARATLAALLPGDRAPAATPKAGSPATLPALDADSLLRIAESVQGGGTISYVTLAKGAEGAFRVRRRLPGELHPNGRSMVSLDPRTGAVLERYDARTASVAARADYAAYPLHIGRVFGAFGRWLMVAVGLTPLVLAVTGVVMWRRRARRTAAPQGRAASAERKAVKVA